MRYYGYAGKLPIVDLSTGEIRRQELTEEMVADYTGGFGINARLFYDLYRPNTDPLAPGNPVVIGCGPFVGTFAPGTSKTLAITRFPLTMTIGQASAGMNLGNRLKYAGYDGLALLNAARSPVYIRVLDDSVEICDASFLWGKDTYETTDWFWDNFGTDWSVLAIGQAGENRAYCANALVDKASTLGKGGLGAVLGSKKVKAIAVKGTKGLRVARPKKLWKLVDELMGEITSAPYTYKLMKYGKTTIWNNRAPHFLYRNYTEVFPVEKSIELFGQEVYMSKLRKGRVACLGCPLGEKELLKVQDGEFKGVVTYLSNWPGRVRDWGARLNLENYGQAARCAELANRYGLCAQTTSSLIELAIDLYAKGVIPPGDTGGVALELGFDTAARLIEQIATGKGIGKTLAGGFRGVIERYGTAAERAAVTVKGMDPQLDPRASCLAGPEFDQIVNPRGARHQAGGSSVVTDYNADTFRKYCRGLGMSDDDMARLFADSSRYSVGAFARHAEDWYSIASSVGVCAEPNIKTFYDIDRVVDLYGAITGIDTSARQLKEAGERAWNLVRVMNAFEGFTRKQDRPPEIWFSPLDGEKRMRDHYKTRALTREDVERLLDDYYAERGWDVSTGIPGEQKCRELGFPPDLIARIREMRG